MRRGCENGWMTWAGSGGTLLRNPCGRHRKPGLERRERAGPLNPTRRGKDCCTARTSASQAQERSVAPPAGGPGHRHAGRRREVDVARPASWRYRGGAGAKRQRRTHDRAQASRGKGMANDEHVALLKQEVDVWNAWRQENPDIRPDLIEADLREADL